MATDKNSFEYVSEKLGRVEPATLSIAREVFEAAKKAGHQVWYMWGYDGNASNTEHHSGRALDFMVHNHAAGQWVRNYIWSNRSRLRLQHVIWEQHITSTVTSPGVVRKMADRGSPTENHMDHVHALFIHGTYRPVNKSQTKTVDQLADEVIAGKWGNGDERKTALTAAGYNYAAVQALVEKKLKATETTPRKKSVATLAQEVIAGKWGNDPERSQKLKKAGYDAAAVQKEVDRLLK